MLRAVGLDDHVALTVAAPRRPAACVISWNVRSGERKSGILSDTSAETIPERPTLRKSSPLAMICVPMRICVFPLRKAFSFRVSSPFRFTVSKSRRSAVYSGNRSDTASSSFSVPLPKIPDIFTAAFRALVRRRFMIATVVTHRLAACFMISQRKTAARASGHIAALPAGHKRRISPPVEKQDHLSARFRVSFILLQSSLLMIERFPRFSSSRISTMLTSRQHHFIIALCQFQKLIDPFLCPLIRYN